MKFNYQRQFVESTFMKGEYILEITKTALNKNGDPFLTTKVVESFDGKRINMHKAWNFHVTPRENQSVKANKFWNQKFSVLLQALGITELEDLDELDGKQVGCIVSNSDPDNVPNFCEVGYVYKRWGKTSGRVVQEAMDEHKEAPFDDGTPPPNREAGDPGWFNDDPPF